MSYVQFGSSLLKIGHFENDSFRKWVASEKNQFGKVLVGKISQFDSGLSENWQLGIMSHFGNC